MIKNFVIEKRDYSKHNLSYLLFKNIQANFEDQPLDLQRVDFRGSKFVNCAFNRNNFDRSDVIDSYFEDVTFNKVNFGTALFKNSFFERIILTDCYYDNTAVQECTFKNCTFDNSNINWILFNCKFIDCSFKNIRFDHSCIDSNKFIDCDFIKCYMAECHMENIQFQSCLLRQVEFDSSYLSTYFFRETDISLVKFKYRGELVAINKFDEDDLNILYNQGRYFNYLNMNILLSKTQNLYEKVKNTISKTLDEEPHLRFYNLKNILLMFDFYFAFPEIDFVTYQKTLIFLNNIDFDNLPFEESLEYHSILCKINERNKIYDTSFSMLNTIDVNEKCLCTLHVNSDDVQRVQGELKSFFDEINLNLLNSSIKDEDLYEIVATKPGSVILIIASSLLLVLLASKVMKSVHNDFQQIRIEKATADQIINLTKEARTVSNLQKINTTTQCLMQNAEQRYLKTVNQLSNSILIGEIISIVISLIF